MKNDCECQYCKNGVNEYFCDSCGLNFNECESLHILNGMTFCPICHPKNDGELEALKIFLELCPVSFMIK